MSLGKINSFLKKFSKLTPPDFFIRNIILETLKEKENINISIEKISLNKEGIVFLKVDVYIKNKIFIKKEYFIQEINKKLKKEIIKDFC